MENNEKNTGAQHSTGKHPEPSDDVQSDIETVTPDTEKPGQEDIKGRESQDKESKESEPKGEEIAESDNDSEPESTEEPADDSEESTGGDVSDDVETVSP